jgi:hypothetical protein
VTETVDPESALEAEGEAEDEAGSMTELIERLGRELGLLVLCQAQLEAARNVPSVRRAVRDVAGASLAALAVLAGFVFLNVAAFSGLSQAMRPSLAGLVLAAVWIVVGGVLAVVLLGRAREPVWRVLSPPSAETIAQLEKARDDAVDAIRLTLADLGPAATIEIAAAAVPAAGDIAGGVLDASDDVVDAIAETLPAGGSVVSQIWSVALIPGRYGLRVATTVLRPGGATKPAG